ncbi:hypothetical protein [Massilia aerilata]|uniref:Uncharacterized protein n=1 Tax=Massilia aerilata TaxID=453817 RepID=A0ABW0RQ31_9BURK
MHVSLLLLALLPIQISSLLTIAKIGLSALGITLGWSTARLAGLDRLLLGIHSSLSVPKTSW